MIIWKKNNINILIFFINILILVLINRIFLYNKKYFLFYLIL